MREPHPQRPERTASHYVKHALQQRPVVLALAVASGAFGPLAHAIDEPADIPVGEARLIPQVRFGVFQDNNAFFEESGGESSAGVLLAPSVQLLADKGTLNVEARYEGWYSREDADYRNYTDHVLAFAVDAEVSSKLRTDAELRFARGHRDPGDYVSVLAGEGDPSLVTADRRHIDAGFIYGSAGARGNLRFSVTAESVDFSTSGGSATIAPLDRTTLQPEARFSLRVSADTRAFVLLRHATLEYDDAQRDRTRLGVFGGVDWEVTGKTSGSVAVGRYTTSYTNVDRDDENDVVLLGSAEYTPSEVNSFKLGLRRELDDLAETGADQVIINNLSLDWRHDWSARIFHVLSVSQKETDRNGCPAQDESLTTSRLELSYKLRRWLYFGGRVAISKNDAEECAPGSVTDPATDYDTRTLGLFVEASL